MTDPYTAAERAKVNQAVRDLTVLALGTALFEKQERNQGRVFATPPAEFYRRHDEILNRLSEREKKLLGARIARLIGRRGRWSHV